MVLYTVTQMHLNPAGWSPKPTEGLPLDRNRADLFAEEVIHLTNLRVAILS